MLLGHQFTQYVNNAALNRYLMLSSSEFQNDGVRASLTYGAHHIRSFTYVRFWELRYTTGLLLKDSATVTIRLRNSASRFDSRTSSICGM